MLAMLLRVPLNPLSSLFSIHKLQPLSTLPLSNSNFRSWWRTNVFVWIHENDVTAVWESVAKQQTAWHFQFISNVANDTYVRSSYSKQVDLELSYVIRADSKLRVVESQVV